MPEVALRPRQTTDREPTALDERRRSDAPMQSLRGPMTGIDSIAPASAGYLKAKTMTISLRLLAASAALAFAGMTLAATPQTSAPAASPTSATKAPTAQQQRMVDCNKQATGKKGVEHKAFMSTCLKGGVAVAPSAKATQQEKMKTCNADAKTKALKGAERKTFMSSCLKGTGVPATP